MRGMLIRVLAGAALSASLVCAANGLLAAPASAVQAEGAVAAETGGAQLPDPLGDTVAPYFPGFGPRSAGPGNTVQSAGSAPASGDTTDSTPSRYYLAGDTDDPIPHPAYHDAAGVVMVRYAFLPEPVYNPVTAAARALASYDRYLATGRQDTSALADFYRHSTWLRDSCMLQDGRLLFRWEYGARGLRAPWTSAMAQGMAISAFARAYAESHDDRWLAAARCAFKPMTVPVSAGGVQVHDSTGVWLEEYPDRPTSHVLNGEIFAILGVYDLVRISGDADARTLLADVTRTLAGNLARYQRNGAILYQLSGENYAFDYQILHLEQLRVLAALPPIAQRSTFGKVASIWATSWRSYPLPRITFERSRVYIVYGQRAPLAGTVYPLHRRMKLLFRLTAGGVTRELAPFEVVPDRNFVGHFCLPARGILENTTVAVLVANDPPTRRSIGVRVSPKVLFSASQMPLSYGRFVRLSAVPIPGRPDGSIVFESGTPSGWRAIRVVRRVGPGGVRMYWHTEPGTKALRARFLANATHEGGTSPVVTLLVR